MTCILQSLVTRSLCLQTPRLSLATATATAGPGQLRARYQIPQEELRVTYSSSSGPGGQNVNKLATKVDIR